MAQKEDSFYRLLQEQRQQTVTNLKSFEQFKVFPRVVLAYIKQLNAKLGRVEEAIDRWQQGTYGVCLSCMCKISRERLVALPYAELCLNCQQTQEKEKAYEMKLIY